MMLITKIETRGGILLLRQRFLYCKQLIIVSDNLKVYKPIYVVQRYFYQYDRILFMNSNHNTEAENMYRVSVISISSAEEFPNG